MVAMQYCLGNARGGEAVHVQFRFVFVFSKHFDSEVSATDMKECLHRKHLIPPIRGSTAQSSLEEANPER